MKAPLMRRALTTAIPFLVLSITVAIGQWSQSESPSPRVIPVAPEPTAQAPNWSSSTTLVAGLDHERSWRIPLDPCGTVPHEIDCAQRQLLALVPTHATSPEDWRPLVEQFFAPEHTDRAVRVLACESGGNPLAKNPNSSASGLFQHLGSLWDDRAVAAGEPGADIWDPIANTQIAAWLVYEGGGWSHWNPSAHCWS